MPDACAYVQKTTASRLSSGYSDPTSMVSLGFYHSHIAGFRSNMKHPVYEGFLYILSRRWGEVLS